MSKSRFKKGDRCCICDKPWVAGLKYQGHHTDYKHDIEATLCYTCHALLHGSAKIYKHPFAKYGKDKAPYIFARRVVEMYEEDKPISDTNLALLREVREMGRKLHEDSKKDQVDRYLDDINAKSPKSNGDV